jgi:tRNA (adenine57-N1/adenine58-N1)-methyltransferase
MSKVQVSVDDSIVLIPKTKGKRICLKIEDKAQKIQGLGVYNSAKLVGIEYGTSVILGRNQYWLLPASTPDCIETLTRKAQIILPKDSALIGFYSDIKPGSRVVEGGLGSAALTIILLKLVGSSGKVISYETRADFAKVGKNNIEKAGLADSWELKMQDITKAISEQDLDAVVLDIPEPWLTIKHAHQALRPGGILASYVPTMNQVERYVKALRNESFIDVITIENLQRELVVGEGGTRPAFDMLGHTGYITVARKVLGSDDK